VLLKEPVLLRLLSLVLHKPRQECLGIDGRPTHRQYDECLKYVLLLTLESNQIKEAEVAGLSFERNQDGTLCIDATHAKVGWRGLAVRPLQ